MALRDSMRTEIWVWGLLGLGLMEWPDMGMGRVDSEIMDIMQVVVGIMQVLRAGLLRIKDKGLGRVTRWEPLCNSTIFRRGRIANRAEEEEEEDMRGGDAWIISVGMESFESGHCVYMKGNPCFFWDCIWFHEHRDVYDYHDTMFVSH